MNIIIRPYLESDWGAIKIIHDEARRYELRLSNLEDFFLPLCEIYESEELFYYNLDVAILDEKIVGFVAYTSSELSWLYVLPKYHQKGIATSLIENTLLKEPNIKYIEVLVGNILAKNLYEKFNFQVIKKTTGKLPGLNHKQVPIWKFEKEENIT